MEQDPLRVTLELIRADEPEDAFVAEYQDRVYLRRLADGRTLSLAAMPWASGALLDLLRRFVDQEAPPPALTRAMEAALNPAEWPADRERIHAAVEAGRPVELCVTTGAAELTLLPWEQLPLRSEQRLWEAPGVHVWWRWAGKQEAPRAQLGEQVDPRLAEGRVLFAWSDGGGGVNAEAHLEVLEDICATAGRPLQVLERATRRSLRDALDAGGPPPVALVLLAHGYAQGGDAGVHLQGQTLSGSGLARLLKPYASTLRLVALMACESARASAYAPEPGVAQRLHAAGIEAVIGARAPLALRSAPLITEGILGGLLLEHLELRQALARARRELELDSPRDAFSLQLWCHREVCHPIPLRPYRGLQVFEAQHRSLFFGREAEVDEVVSDLAALRAAGEPAFVLIAGASGTGKSSLARAGALPTLKQQYPVQHVLRPGDVSTQGEDVSLWLVDQLEELFTDPSAQADAVLQRTWAHAQRPGCAVLATMRVGYLGRCQEVCHAPGRRFDQVVYQEAHRVLLPRMERASLLRTITEPARCAGLPVEEGLPELLLDELADDPGALPVLQFALDELWRARRPGEGLSLRAYQALGRVGGLISRRADQVIHELPEQHVSLARRLLLALVALDEDGGRDLRQRRTRGALGLEQEPGFQEVFDALVRGRLIVTWQEAPKEGPARDLVELAHEELLRRWERLRAWVAEDRVAELERRAVRARVAEAMGQGEALAGAWLKRALELLAARPDALEAELVAFVTESERQGLDAEAASRDLTRMALTRWVEDEPAALVSLLRAVERPEAAPGWWQAAFDVLTRPIPDMSLKPGWREGVHGFQFNSEGTRALLRVSSGGLRCVSVPEGVPLWHFESELGTVGFFAAACDLSMVTLTTGEGRCAVLDGHGELRESWVAETPVTWIEPIDAQRVVYVTTGGRAAVRRLAEAGCAEGDERVLVQGSQGVVLGDRRRALLVWSEDGAMRVVGLGDGEVQATIGDGFAGVRLAELHEEAEIVTVQHEVDEENVWTLCSTSPGAEPVVLGKGLLAGRLTKNRVTLVSPEGVEFYELSSGRRHGRHRAQRGWDGAWISDDGRVVVARKKSVFGVELLTCERRSGWRSLSLTEVRGRVVKATIEPDSDLLVLETEGGSVLQAALSAPWRVQMVPLCGEHTSPRRWGVTPSRRWVGVTRRKGLVSLPMSSPLSPRVIPEQTQIRASSNNNRVLLFAGRSEVWCEWRGQGRVVLADLRLGPGFNSALSPDGAWCVCRSEGVQGLWDTTSGTIVDRWESGAAEWHEHNVLAVSGGAPHVLSAVRSELHLRRADGSVRRYGGEQTWVEAGFVANTTDLWLLDKAGGLWSLEADDDELRLLRGEIRRVIERDSLGPLILTKSGGLHEWVEGGELRTVDTDVLSARHACGIADLIAVCGSDGGLSIIEGGSSHPLRGSGEPVSHMSFLSAEELLILKGHRGNDDGGQALLLSVRDPQRRLAFPELAREAWAIPGWGVLLGVATGRTPAPQVLWETPLTPSSLMARLDRVTSRPLPSEVERLAPKSPEHDRLPPHPGVSE